MSLKKVSIVRIDKLNDAELGNLKEEPNEPVENEQQGLHPEEIPLNQNASSNAALVQNHEGTDLRTYWRLLSDDKQMKTICAIKLGFFTVSAGFLYGAYELFKDLRQPTESEWDELLAVIALFFAVCGVLFAVAFVYMLIELACTWFRRNAVRPN